MGYFFYLWAPMGFLNAFMVTYKLFFLFINTYGIFLFHLSNYLQFLIL